MKRLLFAAALSAACAMPSTAVRTPDSRPSLAITGAPPGTQLFVDGNAAGDASAYDGQPSILLVEPGTHVVDVRDASGKVLFTQTVFVESETKTIQVH
ncbi:MAG TPA: hypothetical protein VI356_17630 [Myxococcales bacterium]